MLLAAVVETSEKIAKTSRRLGKIDLLASLLSQLQPEEARIVVPYLSGNTRQGRIGIGYASLRSIEAPAADVPTLTLFDIDETLDRFAQLSGPGSERQRRELLHSIYSRATSSEQRFLSALLIGELRQGALEALMVEALSRTTKISLDRVRRAVMMAGDAAAVAVSLLTEGESGLAQYEIQLFRPVHPMLAQSAEDVSGALTDLGEAALEYKFDGARVQVHKSGSDVVVFSRRLNEVTPPVPEIVEAVRALPAHDLILDGEVLSFDASARPVPFQVTMRRFGRKLEVERMRAEQPLLPFWFDLLYLNGTPVLDEEQRRRFDALRQIAPTEALVPHLTTGDSEEALRFVEQALDLGHEGVMAKAPDAPYMAGARGQSWLKVKQARTLDLVILAAEWGSGRRQGWLSNLHLGARDTEKGGFAMLGKTFKGLTDEMLAWQTEQLKKLEIASDNNTVYVEPKIVAEIAFNEIQVSPRYKSGLALRFARVKSYRTDKLPEQSDTFQTVQQMAGILKG
jgi:DNA ligase-1